MLEKMLPKIKMFIISLKEYPLQNSIWMFLEKVLKLISESVSIILIARFLGPDSFGTLSYVLAFVALFIPLAQMGLFSILIREFINRPQIQSVIKGSCFYLMLGMGALMFVLLNLIKTFFNNPSEVDYFIFIYSFLLFFKCFDVIEYFLQSKLKAIYASVSKTVVIFLCLGCKLWFVYSAAELELFVFIYLIEQILLAISLIVALILTSGNFEFFTRFNLDVIKLLFPSIWPTTLSTLSLVLYTRLDQIMIKQMLSGYQLGLYSSAIKLYEGYVSVIVVVTVSLLPVLIKVKANSQQEYINLLSMITKGFFWLNTILGLFVLVGKDFIIGMLYGQEFLPASIPLALLFLGSGFTAMGSISARYFSIEKMERKLVSRTFVSLILNILLNIMLIPKIGITGSALATVISVVIAHFFMDYFDKDLVELRKIKKRVFRLNLNTK